MDLCFVQCHFHSSLDSYVTLDMPTLCLLKPLRAFKRIGEPLHSLVSFGLKLANSNYRTHSQKLQVQALNSTQSKVFKGWSRTSHEAWIRRRQCRGFFAWGWFLSSPTTLCSYYQQSKVPKLELNPKPICGYVGFWTWKVTKCEATLYICKFQFHSLTCKLHLNLYCFQD